MVTAVAKAIDLLTTWDLFNLSDSTKDSTAARPAARPHHDDNVSMITWYNKWLHKDMQVDDLAINSTNLTDQLIPAILHPNILFFNYEGDRRNFTYDKYVQLCVEQHNLHNNIIDHWVKPTEENLKICTS